MALLLSRRHLPPFTSQVYLMYEGSQKLHKFFRGLVDVNPTGKRKTQLDRKQREVALAILGKPHHLPY